MESFSAIAFLGAMAIFMYGIRLSRTGVQLLAGDRLRSLIASLTNNRFSALGLGILTTLLLQSSTATTALLVGFARTGVMTLTQTMGVILGADIGTTLVVMLLSIRKITDYSLLMLILGVALEFFSQSKKRRYVSMVFVGFGFVFFGMHLMIQTTVPLGENHLLGEIFTVLGNNPPYAFFAALFLTALVQNSATTLGMTMALAFTGLLNIQQSIPIILGANVGTCASSLINSIGGGTDAKRVAISHLLFKLTGALVVLLFLPFFSHLFFSLMNQIPFLQSKVASQVACAHVLFNLTLSLTFLPFIPAGARLVTLIIPDSFGRHEKAFAPKYLDTKSLETPALAFANARREILRMSEIAFEMFQNTIIVFEKNDQALMASIEEQDDKVDILDRETKFYLAKISQESLNPEQARMQLNLVAITSDLEEICDIINKNILELAEKKILKHRQFSEEGFQEITDMHAKVLENFQLTISTLTTEDTTLARKVLRHENHLALLEDRYRESHLQRLHLGLKETIETSSLHLDLLSNFRRINSKLTAIMKATLPGRDLDTMR